ncbi:hypothetical protein B0H14DRAFT_2390994 [Mycena olivaceomarginata]|nr:hypothetical protein B0H14DRAFT_2390994 [Mycena olivaceomarginata]
MHPPLLPPAPVLALPPPDFPHTQPRLRQQKKSAEQKLEAKFEALETLLKDQFPFDTLGEFLQTLFYNPVRSEPDPRGRTHCLVISQFLRGRSDIKMSDILPLMYHHKSSFPTSKTEHVAEQKLMFSTTDPTLNEIHHARPFISTWAVNLVAAEARRQVGRATRDDLDDPEDHTRLRARTNGRSGAHVVSWKELLSNFSMKSIHNKFRVRVPLPIFLTEAMAAPKSKGVYFVRKRRPHPFIQVGAIASFIISRNRYANGHLAVILGVWLFACKSHIDVKRVFCRFGYSVSDTTARNALNSMTVASLSDLRTDITTATDEGKTHGCLLLDNVQEYCDVWEQGIGRMSELKVGCAGTWVKLDDCAPGAFDAKPYYDKVALQERKTLTSDSLFDDIDWTSMRVAIPLQWARALIEYIPQLQHFTTELNAMFRTGLASNHRMREGRKTECQPLPTNSEHSTELQGMARAVADFNRSVGISSEDPGKTLQWIRGDGASYALLLNLSTYLGPTGTFKNIIATPELWHTGATDLNSTAANHYGPSTSKDPSSLSKCSNIAGLKRPSNIKSCDYYPTRRNLTLIWTAHVLDCWRIELETDDLRDFFNDPKTLNPFPDFEFLLGRAGMLVDKYATQSAIQASLTLKDSTDRNRESKVKVGSAWTAETTAADDDSEPPGLSEIEEPDTPRNASAFTGDRVLRNSQIFMQDFGWWVEFAHSIPEGDIGRAFEIMKIWIFKFAGSSHANYVNYLLEVYCLLRYEASKDLKNAILNNWLLNINGELGRWLPGDQHQEHYNKWTEYMMKKHGGEFDEPFYRQTISPNVHHFLLIKEEVETSFDFQSRGQTHTSPSLSDELGLLLRAFKEEEVHLFRSGRSLGHAAVNQFARGWRRLDEEKLDTFLTKSTVHGDFLQEIRGQTEVDGGADTEILMRSDSPAQSIPSSDLTDEGFRAPSASSVRSASSNGEPVDPNEPEDDGEDLSDAQLTSGPGLGMVVDTESGSLVDEDDEGEEEDGSDDEMEDVDEEPDVELETEDENSEDDL